MDAQLMAHLLQQANQNLAGLTALAAQQEVNAKRLMAGDTGFNIQAMETLLRTVNNYLAHHAAQGATTHAAPQLHPPAPGAVGSSTFFGL